MPIHDRYCPKFYSKTVQKCTCKPTYTKAELNQRIEQACREQRERDAFIARQGCLVPPDGGSPTKEETDMCDGISKAILSSSSEGE